MTLFLTCLESEQISYVKYIHEFLLLLNCLGFSHL